MPYESDIKVCAKTWLAVVTQLVEQSTKFVGFKPAATGTPDESAIKVCAKTWVIFSPMVPTALSRY
jgi:hypothetical protein